MEKLENIGLVQNFKNGHIDNNQVQILITTYHTQ